MTQTCVPSAFAMQSLLVSTSPAKSLVMPLVTSANHAASIFLRAPRKSLEKTGVDDAVELAANGKLVMHCPLRQSIWLVVVVAVEVPIERSPSASIVSAGVDVPWNIERIEGAVEVAPVALKTPLSWLMPEIKGAVRPP